MTETTQTNIEKTFKFQENSLDPEVDKKTFGILLKLWRLRNGLTQRQVAARWGTSRDSILRAEKARDISWEHAYKLFINLTKELESEKR